MLSERIAAKYLQAAFFNVGDMIAYGKYKNKKGRIVRFDTNDKGQPIVEIEPIPKGRKKNKVMGLFKIWNLQKVEEAQAQKEAQGNHLAQRVAARFFCAAEAAKPAEKATKKKIMSIYNRMPVGNKMLRGGAHIIMLSGNSAKAYGVDNYTNVKLEELSMEELEKVAKAVGA